MVILPFQRESHRQPILSPVMDLDCNPVLRLPSKFMSWLYLYETYMAVATVCEYSIRIQKNPHIMALGTHHYNYMYLVCIPL
jgi:hypothetical protein